MSRLMVEGGVYPYLIPLARTVAGFGIGVMLGICGGWVGKVFNAMIGFPWHPIVHGNIVIVCIGIGAGLGAYFAWMILGVRWYLLAGSMLLVLGGGIAGAYLGFGYGHFKEPNYLGPFATIDSMTQWGAAIGGITVATGIGLFNYVRTMGR